MNELIVALCTVLQNEAVVYKKDFDIAERKKQQIINNNLDEIKKLNLEEQNVFYNIVDLEGEREKIVKNIAKNLGKDPKQLTITEIITVLTNSEMVVDKKIISKLQDLKEELNRVIDDIKKINDLNKMLINSSLEYIDFSINLFMGSTDQGIYGNRGQYNEMNIQNKMFDRKY